ncbi:major facilitator superfamily transporter [Penicillium lagena]|uniref:major facilitator superfamily transporter n=1 Tax=Penicillium lagena TaxID=94218 RepID=UPI002541FC60|nr:major facilitator superfamily transporter [Penicillium lagena]KAJ5605327.1 major facilitator superfamily transporter [Penicillium lagena]
MDIIREAPIGQVIRWMTRNKVLQYPEERTDFVLPLQYQRLLKLAEETTSQECGASHSTSRTSEVIQIDEVSQARLLAHGVGDLESLELARTVTTARTAPYGVARFQAEQILEIQRTKSIPIIPQKTEDGIILVDWYTSDDPANPQNWSTLKKSFVIFVICMYTWVTYLSGSLFVSAEPGVEKHFGVSAIAAELGLALFVLAYGVGPLIFGPLTEIPVVGRNPVYVTTFVIYWALSFPTATAKKFGGLLALRFFGGLFGSAAIGIGGATIGDMLSLIYFPYGLGWWILSFWAGPAIGPSIGNFLAVGKDWRWPLWEIVWISSPMLAIILFITPETSTPNILLRRANRLRKVTGNAKLKAQSEIDQRNLTASDILFDALIKPCEITLKDPSILFVNVYTAFFYAVYYTFFEVFPLVFPPFYGFNFGETGLAFLACCVGAIIGIISYFAYLYWYMVPDNLKKGFREQEHRLVPAIVGAFLLPIGLFLFAWTSRSSIHWIVPLIGVAIFTIGMFWIVQGLFVYIPISYPKYAASLFTANDLVRSGLAAGCILFARPLFINLGVHKGVTVLAGLSIMGIPGTIVMYVFGKKLRAKSKFAQS